MPFQNTVKHFENKCKTSKYNCSIVEVDETTNTITFKHNDSVRIFTFTFEYYPNGSLKKIKHGKK